MVKHKPTEQKFALKAISKGFVEQQNMIQQVLNERDVLKRFIMSPWIVRMVACFDSQESLYFLMELVTGGELAAAYDSANLFGSARHARFHAACVLRGLGLLHHRQLVYRDMKPENL